jgi:translation initiation factor IF-3
MEIKEVKFRPTIDPHDYGIKAKKVREFLEAGHKVKLTVMFRGRMITHSELGTELLRKMADELSDVASLEDRIIMAGRQQHMLLVPLPPKKKAEEKAKRESAESESRGSAQPGAPTE